MRKNELQRAIDETEGEMRILQQVLDRLKKQQAAKPARQRKTKPVVADMAEARR